MTNNEDVQFVWVRRQWNDWRKAKVRVDALYNVHWSQFSGGIERRTPRPFLHGYIYCTAVVEGEIAHSCRHGAGPHSIKVCIVKKDNSSDIFAHFKQQANSKIEAA